MKKIVLDNRENSPAFFDMSCRWRGGWHQLPRKSSEELGGGFKIGDRAVAYVFLAHWRQNFPHRKLVVIDDPFLKECVFSQEIPIELLLKEIADEVWITEKVVEPIDVEPEGEPLYTKSIWDWWNSANNISSINFNIEINAPLDVPKEPFITISPLFNMTNNVWRNIPIPYWEEIVNLVAQQIPTVVISKDGFPKPAHGEFVDNLSAWQVLGLLKNSKLHVGGETGFTLWAPILGTFTLALYADPIRSPCKPIEFNNSVVILNKNYSVDTVTTKIVEIYEHEKRNAFNNMYL